MRSLVQGLQSFSSEGHMSLYTTVWGPDILRNVIVSGYVAFYQINKLSVNILFFHYSWNGFAGRIWPAGGSLETPDLVDETSAKCGEMVFGRRR